MSDDSATSQQLPPADFATLVISLATQAMIGMGQLANPVTKQIEKNLPVAKHCVDTLEMLEAKTRGNLSDQESKLIERMLTDLRLTFVQVKS